MLSQDEALALLRCYGGQARWTAHCVAVADAAQAIALSLQDHCRIDAEAVWTLAVLHDIGRYATHDPIAHGVEGYRLLNALGHEEHAFVCASHVGFGLHADEAARHGLPAQDFVPKTLEQRIVPLADLLMDGVTPTTVEARLDSLRSRYAGNAEFRSLLDRASRRAGSLIAELEASTGQSVEDLVRSAASRH